MSRELIIKSWCDRCESKGVLKVPAEHTYTIGFTAGESRPALRVIELCNACDAEIDWVPKLLADNSIPLDAPKITPPTLSDAPPPTQYSNRVACRVCGKTYPTTTIAAHVWGMHRHAESRPKQPNKCPECGVVRTSGMAQHRTTAHRFSAIDEAYRGLL
jgi:hypothetical protein